MPETNRPLKVFLSYASQDKPLVRELSRRLVGEGWIDTWQDEKSLLPGQDWRVKIEEAVEDADVVIICLSNQSVTKEGHVQKELRYAREIALEKPEDAIFLIPLRLDECEVPRGLRFYQWVDYFSDNKDSSYKALVASLGLRYEQKIKAEEAENLRKELQEREFAEKIAREKAEKDAAEKARLKVEKEERQRIAKEKAERETVERAERERKEKELREKQVREAREKEKHESEKKEEKPVAVKPKAGGQIAYWFGGIFILVLGIVLFSSLNNPSPFNEPTPNDNQSLIASTSTYIETVKPDVLSTLTPTKTVLPIFTATDTPSLIPDLPALRQTDSISLADFTQNEIYDYWVSPNGEILVLATPIDESLYAFNQNTRILVVNMAQNKIIWEMHPEECRNFNPLIAFNSDGSTLAVGGCSIVVDLNFASAMWLVDADTGTVERKITWDTGLNKLAFSPNDEYLFTLITGYGYSRIRIWDPQTGDVLLTKVSGKNFMESFDVSFDGRYIVIGNDASFSNYADPNLRLWNFGSTSLTLNKEFPTQEKSVFSVAFNSDGETFASSDEEGISVWDVSSGNLIKRIDINYLSKSIDFIKDDTVLVSTGDKIINLYDINSGELLMSVPGTSYQIVFSKSELMIINDLEISVWKW